MQDYVNPELVLTWDWVAGFFDGEGSVNGSYDRKTLRGTKMRLEISQADETILRRIQRFFGAGVIFENKTRGRRRRCWYLRVNKKDDVVRIATQLQQHVRLTRKREALALAASFWLVPPERRYAVIETIRKYNQGYVTASLRPLS